MKAVRVDCYRCWKPVALCICATLPRVENQTEVIVLQHPRERLHPIGTARFARLGLARSAVHVAWNAGDLETEPPSWLPPDIGLLYPSPDARGLETLPPDERPRRLLLLDGTWHTAKTLYRDKRWLHALPHYRLSPEQPGRYRLRREPQHDYLSTIEAVVSALRILEPETEGFDQLLGAFDAMIDRQLSFVQQPAAERRMRKRRRERAARRVPHALVEGYQRLVITYGEHSRCNGEFAYFVAQAVATGEHFACLIRPRAGLPPAEHLMHMGLGERDFDGACTSAEFCARFAEFLARQTQPPLLAAWNQRTLELLAEATGQPPTQLSLKGAYRAVHGIHAHSLEEVVAQRNLTLAPNSFLGRAGRRLGGAVAVAAFLHAGAMTEAVTTPDVQSTL